MVPRLNRVTLPISTLVAIYLSLVNDNFGGRFKRGLQTSSTPEALTPPIICLFQMSKLAWPLLLSSLNAGEIMRVELEGLLLALPNNELLFLNALIGFVAKKSRRSSVNIAMQSFLFSASSSDPLGFELIKLSPQTPIRSNRPQKGGKRRPGFHILKSSVG